MKKIFQKIKKFRIAKFTLFAIFVDVCVIAALVVINHPDFKTFWIPTAMTTMSHKYLAYTLYDVDTVNKIMSENYIEQTNILNTEITNTYFNLKIIQTDFVPIKENILVKKYKREYNVCHIFPWKKRELGAKKRRKRKDE